MPLRALTLGPILFNWTLDTWFDFYARIADEAPVDRVCLGDVVCSKRLPFFTDRMPDVVERLQRGGKAVVLSSLALVTTERERRIIDGMFGETGPEIEVNDLTILAKLHGRPFGVGPFINLYNEDALAFLANRGARHACLPPELPLSSVAVLASAAAGLGVECEVWAFGRLPLAIAGRCYHARIHSLTKDACQFVCGNDPDGLEVETLDGQKFFAINGVQTLSHTCANLIGDIPDLAAAGVTSLRLSPQTCDMVEVAKLFRDVLDGRREPKAAMLDLGKVATFAPFSNGFLKGSEGAEFRSSAA